MCIQLMAMWCARVVKAISGPFLASSAIRCCFVNTVSGLGVPIMFPSNGSSDGASFPPQGPFGMVPLAHRYDETLRLPAAHFAALRFLRLAIPRSFCVSSPFGRRCQADGSSRSLLYRLLPIRFSSRNCQDLPCSRETHMTIRPALRPRRDRVRAMGPRVNVSDTAPAPKQNEGSPQLQISGLNHTAFGLAVYASKWKLPATAQDSLPAAGPSFAGRDSTRRVSMKGF